jgi:hypothetical protein
MIKKLCDHESGDFENCKECQDNLKALKEKSLEDLEVRRRILDRIIREGLAAGDPRVSEPMRQQKIIDIAITTKKAEERRDKGEPDPPDINVGLKTVLLGSQVPRG